MAATDLPHNPRYGRLRIPPLAALGSALALAAGLRFLELGRFSLNLDEAATWWNATRPTWKASALAEANLPPLWWLITRVFVKIFGTGEAALRAPAALFGVVSVWLLWIVSRQILDPRHVPARAGFKGIDAGAPIFVTLLAAFHPFWIEYSQDARMYTALLAGSLGLSALYLGWLKSGGKRFLVGYAVVAALTLYVHTFAILTLIAHATFAIASCIRDASARSRILPLLAAQAAAVLMFLPWVIRSLGLGVAVASLGNFGRFQRLGFAAWRILFGPSLAALDRTRIDAGPIGLARDERFVLAVGMILGAIAILFAVRRFARDASAFLFVGACLAVPPMLLLLVYSRLPLLHEKYLVETAPFAILLAVVGARAVPRLPIRLFLVAFLAFEGLGTFAYFTPRNALAAKLVIHGHPYGKDDYRGAHAWVLSRAEAGDPAFVYPPYLDQPWRYYDSDRLPPRPIPMHALSAAQLDAMLAPWRGTRRIFVVTSGTNPATRDSLVRNLSQVAGTAWGGGTRLESKLFPAQWGVWAYEIEPVGAGSGSSP